MRILIDLQALQSRPNAKRGIGRYSRALIEGMLRNAPEDEFILLLNGMIGEDNDRLRREFKQAWPNVAVRVWTAAQPTGYLGPADRRQAAEAIREAVIADLSPDVILMTSLFEGAGDNSVTTVCGAPTAIVLYDLIPFLFPKIYLTNPDVKKWYATKIEALKRADLLLAISECSARDAIAHLNLPPYRVMNISSDVDAQFVTRAVDQTARDALGQRLGLTRPFLMYTGGIDHRKNIPALIAAFAALPAHVKKSHQLAIVCRATDAEKSHILKHAHAEGLSDDAVIMTGYVSNDILVALYNICTAFVFPSWYEGFGLPVLEAMRCGAPVIGSNVSSIPEVIGREDALFDPHSTADMAQMIGKVLTDDAFRRSLCDFAPVQAARFSWDQCARRTLAALRTLVKERTKVAPVVAITPVPKPRLAFISPLPPERSGISFYSAELLPELAEFYDIDLILAQDTVAETVDTVRFPVRDVQWLRDHPLSYDRVLYQFGNSTFHTHMFELLTEIPGTAVLHDFFLSNIEAHLDPVRFTRVLAENHGYHAAMERYDTAGGRDGLTEVILSWPANARVLRAAEGVIVHSDHARTLAKHFYGESTVKDFAVIPQLLSPCELSSMARTHARAALRIAPDELLICTFGYLTTNKLVSRLMDAFLCSASAQNPKVHLVYVGEGRDLGKNLLARVAGTPLKGRVRITGWASDEVYHRHLLGADFAVQLRCNSRGENSRTVLDCQNYGLPIIVNAHGSMADLRSETVLRIPDQFSDAELAEAIDRLAGNHDLRACIGAAARNKIVTEHAPAICARAYRDAIESFHRRFRTTGRDLFVQLAQLPSDPARDGQLAQAIADSFPARARLRQLLVDVTELVRHDARTGIQRVVRAILLEWLRNPPPGWRVEPVIADHKLGRYRYARQFTCQFLGIPDYWAKDTPIDFIHGDKFVGLDLQPHVIPQMREALSAMAAAGVEVSFVVYDLLPVQMLQHFGNASEKFVLWLNTVSRHERLICISRTVAEELNAYLKQNPPANGLMPQIGWFHLGADLENTVPTTDLPKDVEAQLECLKASPSFLMVGTVEPRKGHAFVLDAFEQFWAKGGDATLVIAGKQGWEVEALCRRLRRHPEAGGRLIWLNDCSDAHLRRLYETCNCLIAASEGEGFGLPLIEAAKHDMSILARDIPVFREVAGGHATYFDGSCPDALVHAIEEWLAARNAGNVLRSGGLGWLTWRESATALLRNLDIEPGALGDA